MTNRVIITPIEFPTVGSIAPGTLFKYVEGHTIYMRLDSNDNAIVELATGAVYRPADTDAVTPIHAVRIERR